jgi:hypothetical protein
MRLNALYLIGALTVLASALPAEAVPAQPDRPAAAGAQQITPTVYACPPGYYWEPDAYAPHGKFRPAHCARRW